MAEMRIINLNQVERGVEEALRNFTNGGNGGEVPEISAGYYRSERETRAKDIEEAGQAAVDIAADIMREAQQLATELKGEREEDERAPAGVRRTRKEGKHRDAGHARRRVEPLRECREPSHP